MINSKVINYGLVPPETSTPIWGDNGINEDSIITSMDFQESLQKLTSTEREIILLYNQGYSVREISLLVNIPTMTVQDTKDRAITKLRKMLDGEDSIYSLFT